jgi:putative restriction endonuclease
MSFGNIVGYNEGDVFSSRIEIKNAELHKYHINGISRVLGIGCDCIVLNGGYIDDKDYGDEIYYTGEGGRPEGSPVQTFDQPFTKGNLDLSRNKFSRDPIRVIRGPNLRDSEYAPADNYRYDGLYYLEDYWPDIGEDGFRIWRYKLVKKNTDLPPLRDPSLPAPRNPILTNRIQRNSNIPKNLKRKYNNTCQVCGVRLEAHNVPYSIGAHIKGLGSPHDGPDTENNMLVLCPNDHYLFDAFAFSINDDFTLNGKQGNLTKLHEISLEYIRYHRRCYEISKGNN